MFQLTKARLYLGIWPAILLSQITWPESTVIENANSLNIVQRQTERSTTSHLAQQVNDPRLARRRTPGRASSRGDCQVAAVGLPQLLTVVPNNYDSPPLTLSERPTFLAYSPYQIDEGMRMEFVLYDRTYEDSPDTPIFTQDIATVGPGVFSIPFPEDSPDLESGEVYEWFIKVYCDTEDIRPAVDSALVTLASGDTASGDVWYDQVNSLANARRQNSGNQPQQAWDTFLRRSGLDDLIEQPILEKPVLE